MKLVTLLWAWTFAFLVFISLLVLRLSNVLGTGVDILIQSLSAISLVLFGVFIGAVISQEQVRIRATLIPSILFALGFLAAPLVAIGVLTLIENIGFNLPALFGVIIAGYLLLYMGLWFRLRRKSILKG